MSDDLKPCPFCGKTSLEYNNDTGPYDEAFAEWWLCGNCGARVASEELWQTRPIEDALLARAQAADARVKELEDELPILARLLAEVDFAYGRSNSISALSDAEKIISRLWYVAQQRKNPPAP